jgi:hypothetical protein
MTSDSTAYGGKLHTVSSNGATASLTFSGTSIAVVAPLGSAYGSLRICIDPGVSVAGCTNAHAAFQHRGRARHRLRQRSSRERVTHDSDHRVKRYEDRR